MNSKIGNQFTNLFKNQASQIAEEQETQRRLTVKK